MLDIDVPRDQVNEMLILLDDQHQKHEVNGFTRWVEFEDAYDKRNIDSAKDCGIGAYMVRMVLARGPRAIQFYWSTGIHPQHIEDEWRATGKDKEIGFLLKPMGYDVGYHSPVPMYEGQTMLSNDCPITGGVCYYDGSGLQAMKMVELLFREGVDAVWGSLEARWADQFGESEDGA